MFYYLRLFIFSAFICCFYPAWAQEGKQDTSVTSNENALISLDNEIENKPTQRKSFNLGKFFNDVDTNYVYLNRYNLAFMLEHSTWYEHYRLGSKEEGRSQSLSFSPDPRKKLGIYFGWRWIFLGYTFDIEKDKNKADKTEMELSIYNARFGFDIYYRKTGSDFKLRSTDGFNLSKPISDQDFDGMRSKIFGLTGYWVFNHRQFSHPAVYGHSTYQRKSAGSFMAGFSYSRHSIDFDHTRLPEEVEGDLNSNLRFNNIKYSDYSLGFGYGYNWVFKKNWIANLSLLPSVGYKKSEIEGIEYKKQNWTKDINFDLVTRAGITYNDSKYFLGASLLMHTYDYRNKILNVTNSFGTLRLYAGFKFWKRKKYRDH